MVTPLPANAREVEAHVDTSSGRTSRLVRLWRTTTSLFGRLNRTRNRGQPEMTITAADLNRPALPVCEPSTSGHMQTDGTKHVPTRDLHFMAPLREMIDVYADWIRLRVHSLLDPQSNHMYVVVT